MPTDKFGYRMHNDICSMINWSNKPYSTCVVYNKWDSSFMSNICKSFKIRNIQFWITY